MSSNLPTKNNVGSVGFPDEIVMRPIDVVRPAHPERHGTPRQAVVEAHGRRRPQEQVRIPHADAFADARCGRVDELKPTPEDA